MSIDWSKANDCAVAALIAKKNNIHYPGFEFVSGYHRTGCMIRATSADDGSPLSVPEDVWEIVERPVTWNGQGLPPVGTNCEYRSNDGWLQCEVVAHRNNAAVVLNHHYEADFVPPQDLRPIRTPEQIAAEERAKAIEEMCFAEETLTVKQAKALFDAGYRRQEEGK
ncbi:hypothetical protein AAER22_20885 [Pseudomonas aeruginosa]|uniref:hypothetical protein n=1 Tax=Pseudomonas aeruginosa TaxID=287 RepID=UPI00376F7A41